ncbi:unnamed protein product [Zymoseptoria tritici ST99CH_1A5]|uniref:Myb-like domain-containing protein n=3 Tax=Zymoseptoria tritici TaxID=1047171 RepID=A0A1X7S044_ZYMT9|nr:unnamed protein product [Zymoseptoria tritici ST99CH_3D7]SMR59437.1 unnamed protein product [Zymoseptoria tritici ST99CH_3D1]SMY26633.1 unnamed protein product [Zymoseptoria tritici ST99CH_1A5]
MTNTNRQPTAHTTMGNKISRNKDVMGPPKGTLHRRSSKGRKLVRWDPSKDQYLLLSIEAQCLEDGIQLPWEKIAKRLAPHLSGQGVKQHLHKLHQAREAAGEPVPVKSHRDNRGASRAAREDQPEVAIKVEDDEDDDDDEEISVQQAKVPRKRSSLLAYKPQPPQSAQTGSSASTKSSKRAELTGNRFIDQEAASAAKKSKKSKKSKAASPASSTTGSDISTFTSGKKSRHRPSNFIITPESTAAYYGIPVGAPIPEWARKADEEAAVKRQLREGPAKNYREVLEEEQEVEDEGNDSDEDIEVTEMEKQDRGQETSSGDRVVSYNENFNPYLGENLRVDAAMRMPGYNNHGMSDQDSFSFPGGSELAGHNFPGQSFSAQNFSGGQDFSNGPGFANAQNYSGIQDFGRGSTYAMSFSGEGLGAYGHDQASLSNSTVSTSILDPLPSSMTNNNNGGNSFHNSFDGEDIAVMSNQSGSNNNSRSNSQTGLTTMQQVNDFAPMQIDQTPLMQNMSFSPAPTTPFAPMQPGTPASFLHSVYGIGSPNLGGNSFNIGGGAAHIGGASSSFGGGVSPDLITPLSNGQMDFDLNEMAGNSGIFGDDMFGDTF